MKETTAKASLPSLPYAISKHPFSELNVAQQELLVMSFNIYMSMNVSIIILFVRHPRHKMPQLLDRKIFRQFLHLPLTGLETRLVPRHPSLLRTAAVC